MVCFHSGCTGAGANPWRCALTTGSERRELLTQYILMCVRDSALSWSDIASPAVFEKLLKILSKDVKVALKDLGQKGSAGLLRVGVTLLAGFAENVARKR